jgi:hypothetical protein
MNGHKGQKTKLENEAGRIHAAATTTANARIDEVNRNAGE